MIYLDSAATSYYRPQSVITAVTNAMITFGNCSRGSHGAAMESTRTVYQARKSLNNLFHGDGPEQLAFTANATESLNIAIKGLLNPGDLAVTTVLEHNSVLRPLYEMEKKGVELSIVGCDENGRLLYDHLERELHRGAKLLAVTHASNLTGNLTDLTAIGALCKKTGTLLLVDASQTAGIFPIDMEKDNISVLAFTGHKSLLGPQGTGGLCVRKNVEIRPLLSGGSGIETFQKEHPKTMPTRLEAGTLNSHGIAGLLAGVRYLTEQNPVRLREKEVTLARTFYEEVRDIPGIHFYGDFTTPLRAPIVSLNLGKEDSAEVSDCLAEDYAIYTRPGGHCAPLMHRFFGTERQGAVRFSFSHFNTLEQIHTASAALHSMV